MITVRKSDQRGRTQIDWLNSWHTFSFGDYYDPKWMAFGPLRVINEDFVGSGQGFGMHPHRDMEIITYIVKGALQHRDSLGSGSVIRPGDVQRMTAGTGIRHSEFNPSPSEAVHLLQIWIMPNARNLAPGYEEKFFSDEERQNKLRLIASPDGSDGSVKINQDAQVYASIIEPGATLTHDLKENRYAWLQVARGSVSVNDVELNQGDGAGINREDTLVISAKDRAELLLFDLA